MTTQNIALTISMMAIVNIPKHRYVGFDGGLAAAGAKAVGISEVETDADEMCPVNTHGKLLVEAGGAITKGSEVEVGADGKAVPKASGVGAGWAMQDAAAAGELITVLV